MAEVEAATVITPSVSTTVTFAISPASETDNGGQAYNGLFGYWISDPLVLSGDPVTASVVRWTATIPSGTTLKFETSINNGASWDKASNNGPVLRLAEGDTTTRFVLARITFTRPTLGSTSPKVSSFELAVSADASTDELVAVGHGMVDKVTVHAIAGSTGAGGSTVGPSSSAVIAKGGGQLGGGTSIMVHVTDLSRAIKRNVWQEPFTVASGLNYGDAIQAMVLDRLPSQTQFSISSTTRTLPDVVVYGLTQGGDPWQDCRELAQAIGYECFFDPNGIFVFQPVPDPTVGDPVWEFDEDSNPLVAEAVRELADDQTFNHVIVIGQSTSSQNAVSAEAQDTNPNSPTYILGPYGQVTERLTFSLITTQDQAQDVANSILNNSLGASDQVTITVVPQPALEPGDIIKINCSDVRVNGNYMINSMTLSLSSADPQQLVCFRQSTD